MRAGWGWILGCALAVWGVRPPQMEAQRLPGGVTPEHYSLMITPDLRAATFSGVETIDVVVEKETDSITLNAADIEFGSVRAVVAGGQPQQQIPFGNDKEGAGVGAEVSLDGMRQQATFRFGRMLPAGPVTLRIEYTGVLNNKLRGFYLSKTKKRSYGVTQFEATDARRAFPSFDEPALKATFDVTLVVDRGDSAISNTPVVDDVPGPVAGKHTVRFQTTPKMSTYLVAWLVGDWACSEGKSEGVPIRVCATPDKAGLTKFALDAAKWDLKYYDRYFGIKYPMAKMDLVAIPDFEAGAMENFGCLTFRETELLVDDRGGAIAAKKEVATTVAHEISHQWFGDMVTMQWWDNLWLNEGFATWMETKTSMQWRPEWKFAEDVAVELDGTMDLDTQPGTRPIRSQADTPAEIDEMFDGIAYGKAGAVIGMVENWVGEELFRKGVQEYLRAHLYGNATAEDFWGTQTRVSGLPVDKVMRSFVEQPGVPLVILGDKAGASVPVRQNRFLTSDQAAGGEAKLQQTWTIPLCLKDAGCKLVEPTTAEVDLGPGAGAGILFANGADKGYYRTVYSADEMKAINAGVETQLTAPERIGLLSDRWALMRAGMGSVGDYLDLALAVKFDSNATVVDDALTKVEQVQKLIADEADRERLNEVVRREFGPVYASISRGVPHDDWAREQLRSTLYEALGDAGDSAVLADANRVTAELFTGKKPQDASVADASVALAAKRGDTAMYDKMLAVAENATDPGLKTDALHLLTRFDDPLLVVRTLEYAVSDAVRSQDSWSLIALELDRSPTQDLAWQFVVQHWTDISRKITVNVGSRLVESAANFCSVQKRDEVEEFFTSHPVASERTLRKSLASIDSCVRLREAQEPKLRAWLDAHTSEPGHGSSVGER
jgi:aminopeptidase N